ncbi:MAG: FAD-dependent oxidoreductase [Gaiellales bacterium]
MAPPVMLAVDDDPEALAAVERQLIERYGGHYRVEAVRDPAEAQRVLERLGAEGADVALVLAGQSATDDDGALLDRARRLHPQAKRAALVSPAAWADPATAATLRDELALGRVDHFVLVPGTAPDEVFHEAISTFLLEWARERRLVPQTVQVVGEEWSGRAYELRAIFETCSVPHSFYLADSDKGRELIAQAGPEARLPLMVLPGGHTLSDPSNAEIAAVAGAPSGLEKQKFDVIVVGAGPAGLSAAVYGASEGLRVLVIDAGGIGGQARSSPLIRNYLGFPRGISGSRLAEQAYEQAFVFGASFFFLHRATALERSDDQWLTLTLDDDRRVDARAVILATGASYRRLGIPELEQLSGAGVFYGGPAAEAPALEGKEAFVVGGGNSAGQAALHLARYARRVTLLVRASSLEAGMSHYLVRAVEASPKIVVRTGTTVAGGGGDGRLQQLVLRDGPTGGDETVPADALFVLIGARPQTEWLPVELAREPHGFLLTGDEIPAHLWPLSRRPFSLEASMPGVLAAGDVRNGSVMRVASAVGEGAIAVRLVHRLLAEGDLPAPAEPTDVVAAS